MGALNCDCSVVWMQDRLHLVTVTDVSELAIICLCTTTASVPPNTHTNWSPGEDLHQFRILNITHESHQTLKQR